ncbi:MAG: PQQ-binding-like beta-propeller repeat protein [Planctomycetes bacterium]|nr:PQQ-binding-like beta-propeller repeat protein [Planctomycetota bacterium]
MSIPRAAFLAVFSAVLSVARAGEPAALQEAPVDELLRANPSGICVLAGAGDGSLAVRAAEGGRRLVHVLEADEARVRTARAAIEARKLAGLATVEFWPGADLPYPENLVNLLVCDTAVREAEALRVLAPGGAALVRRGGAWTLLRKPRPADFDDWTHWRHGADGNMVSADKAVGVPTGLRWVAGPAQDAGGKKWYYDHILVSANGRNFYDYEDQIVARDAYNGVLLWVRPLKAHAFKEAGLPLPPNPTPKMKLAGRVSKVRPVASGDRLFVASEGKVLALDAASGETAAEFGGTRDPRELLLEGGLLIVSDADSIRAFDPATRKSAWEMPIQARRIVAEGDHLLVVTATHVVGLDRATGKEKWRTEDADAALALTCTAHGDYLVLEKSTLRDDPVGCGIKVYSAKTGELLWTKDYSPDMTHYREARAYFAQGLLWLPIDKEGLVGLEPKNGSERKQWKTRGKHCATPVATERFFLAPECEFTDLADGTQTRSRMFKSACRQPFIPANGLLYTFPVQCECFPMLRGTMGLSSDKPAELAAGPRLEKGAAAPAPAALLKPAEGEWPVYRHDAWRSGATPAGLRRAEVRRAWETSVASLPEGPLATEWKSNPFVRGPLTPPVAAGGMVFVAVPDLHRVAALDAKTGKTLWTYTAGGRLDGPPTIFEDLCLFGAHDGWVYCLRASDGLPVWRLRAAPREGRIMAYGQIESPWPVVSSVLVDGGVAYVAGGRHPTADGGVRVLAIRPRTGDLVWEKTIDNLDAIKGWYGGTLQGSKTKVGVDFEPVDMLVRDGDLVAMSRWQFSPATGDFKLALNDVSYDAPGGLEVPRGLWGYGIRQTKMVQPKPPSAFGEKKIHTGVTGDAAMILAGGTLITITAKGDLRVGEGLVTLGVEPVYDGLIAAYGSLFLATQKGTLVCIE